MRKTDYRKGKKRRRGQKEWGTNDRLVPLARSDSKEIEI
jgi:hypothetical protein